MRATKKLKWYIQAVKATWMYHLSFLASEGDQETEVVHPGSQGDLDVPLEFPGQ